MSSDRAPHVVLLRSGSDPDPYVDAFVPAGFTAGCTPVLAFTFPRQDELLARLQQPERYGGLICTSPRAVQAMHQLFAEDTSLATRWQGKTAYAVGPRTAADLRTLGFEPRGEDSGSAEALSAVIARKNLLFLCGNRRRDALPQALSEAGTPFEQLIVYETHPRSDISLPDVVSGDWLAFFSPSGIEAIAASPHIDPTRYRLAAIGPTTAAALKQCGWHVAAVAEQPTPEALVTAVQAASQRASRR